MAMNSVRLQATVNDVPARGGAAVCEANDHVVIFGGADREQASYQDTIAWSKAADTAFSLLPPTIGENGDVPMPRSGHAMVGYGKYVLLFGGIDFAEEAVFNDVYALDIASTSSWRWHYVGDAGAEIPARNSHSLCVVELPDGGHVLVVFGGASPEHGPLGDGYYAVLPPAHEIDLESFHLHWNVLPAGPSAREVHSAAALGNMMVVSGGRNMAGVLADTWVLRLMAIDRSVSPATAELVWEEATSVILPEPRCAHTAAFMKNHSNGQPYLALFGGYNMEAGIFNDSLLLPADALNDGPATWKRAPTSIPLRFGHTMCSISQTGMQAVRSHPKYGPLLRNAVGNLPMHESSAVPAGALVFGGVNAESDFGDIWLLILT